MTSSSHPSFRLLIGWCCLTSSALLIMTVYLAAKASLLFYLKKYYNEKTWICSTPCETGSFSLENGTVKVTVSGLYYFHAQVYFIQITQTNYMPTVTLLKNKGPGTKERKLSQVKRNGPGLLTMIRLVKLNEGDSISLKINPIIGLSGEDYDTYWEIILFNNK
uniref:Lymphotoxin alpha (TNF superfamily, member 1) n=1 Tax=Sinocyclocheilus anshuiensis TaxID=1608454 RepID=A0A671M9Q9_9TELE